MDLAEELLRTDFEECSELLQHYDERFGRVVIFVFSTFALALLSVVVLLHAAENIMLKFATISAILLTAWVGGTVFLTSLARNRQYFCRAASYVSEIRQYYLDQPSIEVENKSGMFTEVGYPDLLTPTSSRTVLLFGLAVVNSAFFGLGMYYALQFVSMPVSTTVVAVLLFLLSAVVQSITLQQNLTG